MDITKLAKTQPKLISAVDLLRCYSIEADTTVY